MFLMEGTEHLFLFDLQDGAASSCSRRCHTEGLIRSDASLAQEIAASGQCNGRFLAVFGDHAKPTKKPNALIGTSQIHSFIPVIRDLEGRTNSTLRGIATARAASAFISVLLSSQGISRIGAQTLARRQLPVRYSFRAR
jgi:hypothetical protein